MASSFAGGSISLFVYLLILDGAAIFFFTRGFLLTRTEVPMFSSCADTAECSSCIRQSSFQKADFLKAATADFENSGDIDVAPDLAGMTDVGENRLQQQQERGERDSQCWTKPALKKAVIIIIDALRFDFVAHSRNFHGERKPWMDRLCVLQRQAEENNGTARMFKFVADPPTTTLQRLKGLTTGGIPTFIDIGNSFGAPAILEDNLLFQLKETGKRVIMMGDDTWVKLFPTEFAEAYPFPSFNVKDLHTVDDGVIRELFPAMHRDNWDVLIAHFLGVDHVGHIFGVESPLMVGKLEQYNKVIENVIELLVNMSEPGGLFEDTLLIVMGDHGQTLNGDHGGGTPEEVETALFALITHHLPSSLLPNAFSSACDLEDPISGCINTFSQLDFSATLAALLDVPFHFGSLGHVNADLFTLAAGHAVDLPESFPGKDESLLSTLKFMERYHDVLCINSWQVRRYIEVYGELAISGFPRRDLVQLDHLYTKAQNISRRYQEMDYLLRSADNLQSANQAILKAMAAVREQVEARIEYLSATASLARTMWTQFSLELMIVGFLLLIAGIAIRALVLYRLSNNYSKNLEKMLPSKAMLFGSLGSGYLTAVVVVLHPVLSRTSFHWAFSYVNENLGIVFLGVMVITSVIAYFTYSEGLSLEGTFETSRDMQQGFEGRKWDGIAQLDVRTLGSFIFVALHSSSLFSNSYIVSEGQVIHFLVASSGFLYLRSAFQAKSKIFQAVSFLVLIWVIPRIHILAIFKDVTVGETQVASKVVMSGSSNKLFLYQIISRCTPVLLPLAILSWLPSLKSKNHPVLRLFILAVRVMHFLIGVHWLMVDLASSQHFNIPDILIKFNRLHVPRLIYAMTVLLTLTAGLLGRVCSKGLDGTVANYRELVITVATALLSGASGTIILLMGRKGPLLSLLMVLEVLLLMELQSCTTSCRRMKIKESNKPTQLEDENMKASFRATVDWSLIATQVFFCTGHSCSFDGLHFSAAFIGFDEFSFYQQGLLITTETYGASHVLPVVGLPLLVLGAIGSNSSDVYVSDDRLIVVEIIKGYLWFGLLQAVVVSATTASVAIQRRHLMVWGIFAPKYAFDTLGFLAVDVLVILVTLLYFGLKRRHNL